MIFIFYSLPFLFQVLRLSRNDDQLLKCMRGLKDLSVVYTEHRSLFKVERGYSKTTSVCLNVSFVNSEGKKWHRQRLENHIAVESQYLVTTVHSCLHLSPLHRLALRCLRFE